MLVLLQAQLMEKNNVNHIVVQATVVRGRLFAAKVCCGKMEADIYIINYKFGNSQIRGGFWTSHFKSNIPVFIQVVISVY